jgi:signal transduction histidine kinase
MIFEPVWRKSRGNDAGAGLVLGTVGCVVEAHGGRATVQSASGGGAIFVGNFPDTSKTPSFLASECNQASDPPPRESLCP